MKLTLEEINSLQKRLDRKEMTDQDAQIMIEVIDLLHNTWWAKYTYRIFIFCTKLEKLLGLEGKTWLSGYMKK